MGTHYVSPTGTATWAESTNINTPCSITTMQSNIADGDTAYLRGGTYHQDLWLEHGTICGYTGETAIIDGEEDLPVGEWAALVNLAGTNVVLQDVTVQNSLWIGVALTGSYCSAINVYANNNYENGIVSQGAHNTIDSCQCYYNAKSNEFGSNTRGTWAGGCDAAGGATYTLIKNCIVWNNWGEPCGSSRSAFTTIQDCIIYNNWRGCYFVDTQDSIYERNLIYTTTDNPCAGYTNSLQWGITFADEGSGSYYPSARNKAINNLVYGCETNFQVWSGTGLVDCLIANNTFVNSIADGCIALYDTGNSNSTFSNNIVIQEDSLPVVLGGGYSGIAFQYNNWSKTAPVGVQGTGDQTGDPLLLKSGPTTAGNFNTSYFKIGSGSPARNNGITVSAVTVDFWQTSRPQGSSPDIGAHEYTDLGFHTDLLELLLNATPIANVADNASSSPLTSLYVSLHTSDPGESGNQSTNECSYTGYSRVVTGRTTSSWSVSGATASNSVGITFSKCGGGSSNATYFGIGSTSSGAGVLYYSGTLSTTATISSGITPYFAAGELNIWEH